MRKRDVLKEGDKKNIVILDEGINKNGFDFELLAPACCWYVFFPYRVSA